MRAADAGVRGWPGRLRAAAAVLAAVLVVAAALWPAWSVIGAEVLPRGDFASDLLRAGTILRGEPLLSGHYSRFGFYHPGPGFFYLSTLPAAAGRALGLSDTGAWHLASLLTNAGFAVLLAWIAARVEGLRASPAALLLGAGVTALAFAEGMVSVFMPDRIVLPFACLFLSLVAVARGDLALLPVAAALSGLLVHGYVVMVGIAVPLWCAVAAVALWRARRADPAGARRAAGLSALVAGVMALPIVADALLRAPSNLDRILGATGRHEGEAGLAEVLGFAAEAAVQALPAALLLLLPLALWVRRAAVLSAATAALGLALLALALAFFSEFPGRLKLFSGAFLQGAILALPAPLLLAATCAGRAGPRLGPRLRAGLGLAALLALAATPQAPPRPTDATERLRDALLERLEPPLGTPGNPVVIRAKAEVWPETVALVYALDRAGLATCQSVRHVLFTDRHICPKRAPTLRLVPAEACAGARCDAVAGGYGLRFADPALTASR